MQVKSACLSQLKNTHSFILSMCLRPWMLPSSKSWMQMASARRPRPLVTEAMHGYS